MVDFLGSKPTVGTCPLQKKNVILLHLECMEEKSFTEYTEQYGQIGSYLWDARMNGTHVTNHLMQLEQSYTAGTVVAQHSGLPLLTRFGINRYELAGEYISWSDYLSLCGWSHYLTCTKYCSESFQFINRNYTIEAKWKDDRSHYRYLIDDMLPRLAKDKEPFSLISMGFDTHPRFVVDEKCLEDHPEWKKIPVYYQAINCLSTYVEELINKVKELGLDKNSVVFVYGDHPLWIIHHNMPRYVMQMFPLMEKREITKRVDWYDFAPTLMNLLGFEDYGPEFPFGADMFSNETTGRPTIEDRAYLDAWISEFLAKRKY